MLKKSIISLLTALSVLLQIVPVFAARSSEKLDENIKIAICAYGKVGIYKGTDEVFSSVPYIKDEVMMIPLRWMFEKLGYTVTADGNIVSITGSNNITVSFNSNEADVNGQKIQLEQKTEIYNGTLFISEDIFRAINVKYNKTNSGYLVISEDGSFDSTWENTLNKIEGIYVSQNGKDSAKGTAQEPVNTLESAKKLAAKYMEAVGKEYVIRIFVKAGRYYVDKTITFNENAFTLDVYKGLSIEGYGDGEAEFTGAVILDQEKFEPVTDAVTLSKLHKSGRGKIATLDLKESGITELIQKNNFFNYIYLNNVEQTNARWPNDGYAYVGTVPQENTFTFLESNPLKWVGEKEGYVCGTFSSAGWEWKQAKIGKVDAATKQITLTTITNNATMKTSGGGSKYYATNILAELDAPGEWYIDHEEMLLYYYPSYSMKDVKLEMVTMTEPMIQMQNCKNITFKNLSFTKGYSAIQSKSSASGNVRGITINGCKFSHMQGDAAVNLNPENAHGVFDVHVDENDVYNLFGKFVQFKGGEPDTLQEGNCTVNNNHVTLAAQYYGSGGMGSPWMGSCGVESNNNLVQDVPRGSAVGWNGTINYNEIINTGKDMNDYGAIYVGRSAAKFGTEVAYNYVHDNADSNYCALYNDDAYCYAKWHHNIVKDVKTTSIFAPGIEAQYKYNVSIGCKSPVQLSSRLGYGTVYKGQSLWTDLKNKVDEYSVYLEKYPKISEYLERDPFAVCWDGVIYGNVGVDQKTLSMYNWDEITEYGAKEMEEDGKVISLEGLNGTLEGNPEVEYSDDLFVDAQNQNYNINPESELAKQFPGLLGLDIEHSGIQSDNPILLEIPEQGSRLRYPMNGQKNLNSKNVTFYWDPVKGASFYRIIIGTDPKMENIIIDDTVREHGNFNSYTAENLDNDTYYYWKVQAINVARQNSFTLDSVGGPYLFKTAKRGTVDKENLKLAMDSFETFCNSDLQNPDYEFEEDYKNMSLAKLSEVKAEYSKLYSQDKADELEEELYTIIKKSPFYMKLKFENIDGAYNASAWEISDGGNISVSNGELAFSSSNKRAEAKVKINNRNSVLCFSMKLDDLGTEAGHYQGFDIKLNSNGKGYLMVIKKDILEWQRVGRTLTEIPNDFIEAGKWYDVEAGGVNTPNGVLQFLRIDGRIIYAELDQTGDQTRDEGYFRMRKNALGNMYIKDMKEVPADGIIIDDLLKSFKEPVSVSHLETLFIGSADVIEMNNSSLFSKLNKKKLAQTVYPVLSEKEINISREDISEYKNFITQMCIVEGYNQGLREELFKNNIYFLYDDYIKTSEIDQNGVTIFSFYNKLNDKFKSVATERMMNKNCKNIDELRYSIAQTIFVTTINACYNGFAADASYISDVLTKENADYLSIDISDYLALPDEKKQRVNVMIGNDKGNCIDRTLDELLNDIHTAVKSVS